ncbi:hypothetical protein MNBD_GAMMA22-171 [hydrothermal vent metagenome]|uniref:Uncharacterized protein n=1 Tax=hydrothermal vent metagenome TaxID=652676 RepID=A0A3B1APF6_9ZZZZ
MYKTLMNAIWDSIGLFLSHFVMLAAITLPFIIFLEVFEVYFIESYLMTPFMFNDLSPLLVAHLTIKPFYSIAVIFYIASVIEQPAITITQSWLYGIRYWPVYFVVSLIMNTLIGTGLLFYAIPGIFLFIRFSFTEFHLLLDKQSPFAAIKSSFVNTRKYFLQLSGGFIIIAVIVFYSHAMVNTIFEIQAPEFNFDLLTGILEKDSPVKTQSLSQENLLIKFPPFSLLRSIISIFYNFVIVIFTIFAFRIYCLTKQKN